MKMDMIKPLVWGAVVGAILMLILVFATGWAITSDSAQKETQQAVENAIIESLVPICIEQFQRDVNKETFLKKLQEMNSWTRSGYVQEQGWATMPGGADPNSQVARECARGIIKLQ